MRPPRPLEFSDLRREEGRQRHVLDFGLKRFDGVHVGIFVVEDVQSAAQAAPESPLPQHAYEDALLYVREYERA